MSLRRGELSQAPAVLESERYRLPYVLKHLLDQLSRHIGRSVQQLEFRAIHISSRTQLQMLVCDLRCQFAQAFRVIER